MSPDAHEVVLYSENDERLYRVLMDVYLPALKKFVKKGVFDEEKAHKLLEYYYQNYVRKWMINPRNAGYDPKLSKEERRECTQYWLDYLKSEYDLMGTGSDKQPAAEGVKLSLMSALNESRKRRK